MPSVVSGIRIEDGGQGNQQQLADGEIYPDRRLVPLALQPFTSYSDAATGKYVENANRELIDGTWYRLTDQNRYMGLCDATKLSTTATGKDTEGNTITLFSVVSTPGTDNYGLLTVRENTPAGEHITYVFEATLTTDGRLIREYFDTKTDSIDEVPDIEFDNTATALYNPLHDERYFTINPKLTIDTYPVTWKWKSYHELEGGWVELESTPLDWAVERVGDGIKIDRERMQDAIMLRCIAEVEMDDTTVELMKAVSHTRQLPALAGEVYGGEEITDDIDTICPHAMIMVRATGEIVTDMKELDLAWYNTSKVKVGEGVNPAIPLSKLNADRGFYLEVKDKGGRAALSDNGALLTDNGALLLVRSKV